MTYPNLDFVYCQHNNFHKIDFVLTEPMTATAECPYPLPMQRRVNSFGDPWGRYRPDSLAAASGPCDIR
jgi:hypothetical protein